MRRSIHLIALAVATLGTACNPAPPIHRQLATKIKRVSIHPTGGTDLILAAMKGT